MLIAPVRSMVPRSMNRDIKRPPRGAVCPRRRRPSLELRHSRAIRSARIVTIHSKKAP
jgi:hypothetical protein